MELQNTTIASTDNDTTNVGETNTAPVMSVSETMQNDDIEMGQGGGGGYEPENTDKTQSIEESNPVRFCLLFSTVLFWAFLILFMLSDNSIILLIATGVFYLFYLIAAKTNSMGSYIRNQMNLSDVVDNYMGLRKLEPIITLHCECSHMTTTHHRNSKGQHTTSRKKVVTHRECNTVRIEEWKDGSEELPLEIYNNKYVKVSFDYTYTTEDESSQNLLLELKEQMDDRNSKRDRDYRSWINYSVESTPLPVKYLVSPEGVHFALLNMPWYYVALFTSLLWVYGLYFNRCTDKIDHKVVKIWKTEQNSLY